MRFNNRYIIIELSKLVEGFRVKKDVDSLREMFVIPVLI